MRRPLTSVSRVVAAGALAVLGLAACGSSSTTSPSPSGPSGPPAVSIDASEYKFGAPSTVTAGLVDLQLHNTGKLDHNAQLVRVDPGHGEQDVVQGLSAGGPHGPTTIPAFIHGGGGVTETIPGETRSATAVLNPGTYVLVCFVSGAGDLNPSQSASGPPGSAGPPGGASPSGATPATPASLPIGQPEAPGAAPYAPGRQAQATPVPGGQALTTGPAAQAAPASPGAPGATSGPGGASGSPSAGPGGPGGGPPHFALGMHTTINVTGSPSTAPLPPGAATVTAREDSPTHYSFDVPQLNPGKSTLTFRNAGPNQVHWFEIDKLNPGVTVDELRRLLAQPGPPPPNTPPPFRPVTGAVGLDPTQAENYDVDLEPGNYVMLCFLPDHPGGAPPPGPHAITKGMITAFTVGGASGSPGGSASP